jgi:ABC-2 type transport system ATP-binding protein
LASYADRRFNTYSTGIRQKFAIARALLTEPRVLFLDEPTRSLDPLAAQEVRRYIADHIVERLGATALLATHTLSEAEAICHRVAIIRHGRLVAAGSMDDLSKRMKLSSVLELVVAGASNRLREVMGARPEMQEISIVADGERSRLTANIDSRDGTLNHVLRLVLDAGAHIESCITRPPTLDDIYRAAHAES